jgi:hypothetical protein
MDWILTRLTHLAHETWNDTVEGGCLESESLLVSAQGTEVLGSLWDNIAAECHLDTANWFAADGHIEVYYWKIRPVRS